MPGKKADNADFVIEGGVLTKYVGKGGKVVIPDGVTSIGGIWAFRGCRSLESVVIPAGVTSIGDEAFALCSSLKITIIHESVKNIGARALFGCRSLDSIKIPAGVTSIGEWAFAACDSLQTIEYAGTAEQWKRVQKGREWKGNDAKVYIGGKAVE